MRHPAFFLFSFLCVCLQAAVSASPFLFAPPVFSVCLSLPSSSLRVSVSPHPSLSASLHLPASVSPSGCPRLPVGPPLTGAEQSEPGQRAEQRPHGAGRARRPSRDRAGRAGGEETRAGRAKIPGRLRASWLQPARPLRRPRRRARGPRGLVQDSGPAGARGRLEPPTHRGARGDAGRAGAPGSGARGNPSPRRARRAGRVAPSLASPQDGTASEPGSRECGSASLSVHKPETDGSGTQAWCLLPQKLAVLGQELQRW